MLPMIASAQSPFLAFPLPDRTPTTALINSVFDHSMPQQYHPDDVVSAFTGEEGRREFGVSTFSVDFGHGMLQGFKNSDGADFSVNGQYSGGGEPEFLFYDGHPGYDYRTTDQDASGKIDVLASASGTVVCVSLRIMDGADMDRVENGGACTEGNTQGEIKIDHGNGYSTIYLHLSSAEVHAGDEVVAHEKIGVSGETGSPGAPHLHFEVRKDTSGVLVPVDPYGWAGEGVDPYTRAINIYLWLAGQELTASNAAEGDRFGTSVAISGTSAIVGAPFNDDGAFDAGSAYIFEKEESTSLWVEKRKLRASDPETNAIFGYSVSVDQDVAAIGARGGTHEETTFGSAYVFEKAGGVWPQNQTMKLTPSDGEAGDAFGHSVSVSGNYVVVGNPNDDDSGSTSGSAYVFERVDGEWPQHQTQKLIKPPDVGSADFFGESVAINGDRIVVGAPSTDDAGGQSGSAYLFIRDLSGTWNQEFKFVASDAASGDRFGNSVAIDGNYIIVGAHLEGIPGSAYIFERSLTDDTWGTNCSIDGDGVTVCNESRKILSPDPGPNDQFGKSVSISGDRAVIGAIHDDDAGSSSGSAYAFERGGGTWTDYTKLVAGDAEAEDQFGMSVAVSGDYAIVGAPFNDDDGPDSGSAYIFAFQPTICSLGKNDPCPPSTRYVATTGSDAGNDCTDEMNPCLTIAYAVSQANDSDIIDLAAGIYNEPGLVIDKNLIITGQGVLIQ